MFNKFEWKEDLSIKVSEMDDEHKEIIKRINTLVERLNESDEIKTEFVSLCDYVVEHFKNEEKFMEENNFSGLGGHKLIHKNLLETMGTFGEEIDNKTLDPKKLVSFLSMWLSSHIKGIDMKYGMEINEKKKSA